VAPVADGGVGNLDVEGSSENETDVTERTLSEVEYGECSDNDVNRIPHSFKVGFAKEL